MKPKLEKLNLDIYGIEILGEFHKNLIVNEVFSEFTTEIEEFNKTLYSDLKNTLFKKNRK